MKQSVGVKPYLSFQPVYMVSTYDELGNPDVMPMSWGGIVAGNYVELNLENDHQTLDNLKTNQAFVLSSPRLQDLESCDYCGMVSATLEKDKFSRSGFHTIPSQRVKAPLIEEFPLALECEVVSITMEPYGYRVLGKIVQSLVDEELIESGIIHSEKLEGFLYDPILQQYRQSGPVVGQAFASGAKRMAHNTSNDQNDDPLH